MILIYSIFFIMGTVVFFVTTRLGLVMRIGLALAVFILPSIVATMWVVKIGDKPLPGAKTVYPEKNIEVPKERQESKEE